jgi:hypothetical protein
MHKKKRALIILTILAILLVSLNITLAEEIETPDLTIDSFPLYRDYLKFDFHINSNITFEGDYTSINSLETKLFQYPKEEENIKIKYLNPFPQHEFINNSIRFIFDEPIKETESFGLHSGLTIYQNKKHIKNSGNFPITNLDSKYQEYLQETNKIKLTQEIKSKSSEIVNSANTDLEAAFLLAEWINLNINYKITPLTENKVQNSEWVFNQKKGVCDELTTLFLAMTRSVGIPSRFVSGLAYTNKDKKFDKHAWAEIYLPEQGWIPFDITYGEFLWIDSTHIPLQKTKDSHINSIQTSGKGNTVEIIPNQIKYTTNVTEQGNYVFPDINIDFNFLSDTISHGSYNLITTTIENKESRYISTPIFISNVADLNILDGTKKFLLIPPFDKKTLTWIIKVNESLSKESLYVFPIEIYTNYNKTLRKTFNVTKSGPLYNKEYIDNILRNKQISKNKRQSSNIQVNCFIGPVYIVNETSQFDCEIKNLGKANINNINMCFQNKCEQINLNKEQTIKKTIKAKFEKLGLQTKILTLNNTQVLKEEYLNFNIKDISNLTLKTKNPTKINFEEDFIIKLNFTANSLSRPKNVTIKFQGSGIKQTWSFDSMDIDQIIELNLKGKHLYAGQNNFKILYSWQDEIKRKYTKTKELSINLENLNTWQKIYTWINKLINK